MPTLVASEPPSIDTILVGSADNETPLDSLNDQLRTAQEEYLSSPKSTRSKKKDACYAVEATIDAVFNAHNARAAPAGDIYTYVWRDRAVHGLRLAEADAGQGSRSPAKLTALRIAR